MKVSIEATQKFVIEARRFLKANKEETKIRFALEKVLPKAEALFVEYNEKVEDLRVDLANVDKNGSILYRVEDGRKLYDYTKEGYKELNSSIKDLFKERNFDLKAHFIKEIPEDLSEDCRAAFEGFVIEQQA